MKKIRVFKSIIILESIIILFIFGIHSWGFWYYNGITVLRDEFGYWEHAASMAGYDWSGAMISAPWYSFGYSLLLLPLFYLFDSMSMMYHAAIFLNGIMMVIVYALVKSIVRRYGKTGSQWADIFIAALVCLYPAYIAQTKVAWAETSIYLTFWLMLWCYARFWEQKSAGWGLAAATMAGVCYVCHNRMIVVMIAMAIVTLFMGVGKKLSWKNVLGFLIPLLVIYFWNDRMRDMLQTRMRISKELEYGLNDIAGRMWRVKAFFTKEGILHWLRSAIGELLYVYLSTFSVGMIGIVCAVRKLFFSVKRKEKEAFFWLFILIVFIGAWALSTLVNMPVGDDISEKPLTYLYYGRYVDGVSGIFLLLGFGHLWKDREKENLLLLESAAINITMLLAAVVTYDYSKAFLQEPMNFVCVPGIWYMQRRDWMNVIVAALGIGAIAQLLMLAYVTVRGSNRYRIAAGIGLAVLFLTVGLSYTRFCIGYVRSYKQDVFAWVERNIEAEKVYCLRGENTRFFAQAQLVDRKIELISEEELQYLGEDCFIITMNPKYKDEFHLCISSDVYYVLVTDGSVYEGLSKSKE